MQEIERGTYIAAPFFSHEQTATVEAIERLLDKAEEPFFSPREYGIIANVQMTHSRTQRIFDMNIRMINGSSRMIAVTDDFDPGVMIEIGYAYAIGVKIVTFSPAGYGSNVMVAKAAWTHCRDWDDLDLALQGHQLDEERVIS